MERHFLLPVTIAAVLHAGLLFGFRGHPAEILVPAQKSTPPHGPEPIQIEIPPAVSPETESASTPDTSPPTAPLSLDERPVEPRPNDFVIETPPRDPAVKIVNRLVPLGPPGMPGERGMGGLGTLSINELDAMPHARVQPPPNYPFEARRSGLNGEVLVEFTVDESGVVLVPRVLRSSNRLFDDAALQAVRRWRFEPGLRGGRAVRFRMAVPIVFSIGEG